MNEYRSFARKIRDPLVPILAAFDENERLDIDSTSRWVDWLITNGHTLFWSTYGTMHFMSMSDSEVLELTKQLGKVIGDRGIFIASVPWQWATSSCIDFVHFAADCGVHAVVQARRTRPREPFPGRNRGCAVLQGLDRHRQRWPLVMGTRGRLPPGVVRVSEDAFSGTRHDS